MLIDIPFIYLFIGLQNVRLDVLVSLFFLLNLLHPAPENEGSRYTEQEQ